MYHVGRPGEDGYAERVLQCWGVDGHNSHTNICSSNARIGYQSWMGHDRPSADFANAEVIFLISSHLESGHYFNPHAQRIVEAQSQGATVICVDPRLSNTGAKADFWLPAWPGTEPVLLLAIARLLLAEGAWERDFVRRWTNWETYLRRCHPQRPVTFDSVGPALLADYAAYTPEEAERVCGVPAAQIEEVARVIGAHPTRFASHNWRAAGAGNLGGWQTARCLFFLNVLTGSVGTVGGTTGNGWNKYKAPHPAGAPPVDRWNELNWPREYPLAYHEMSILLPHFLHEDRGRLEVYFSRVYNPVWTNPDGFSWLEALKDTGKVGCHVALTPTWSETAVFADYVLPMGVGAERHDVASFETHAGRWIGFRQPVLRRYAEIRGEAVGHASRTHEFNPGEVWEENEFWIELSWRIDPDGSLGIRRWFESPTQPGTPMSVDEYYSAMFEGVPGLAAEAAAAGSDPAGVHARPGRVRPARRDVPAVRARGRPGRCGRLRARFRRRLPAPGHAGHVVGPSRGARRLETGRPGRRLARGGGGRRRSRGVPHPVAQARALLANAGRLGLARVRHSDLDPLARALGEPRPRRR